MEVSLGKPLSDALRAMRMGNWHHVLLAVGCALVISLLVSSYWQYSFSMEALAGVKSQRDRIDRLETLLIYVLDAETAVRGYLVTGENAYLEPYRKSAPLIANVMPRIREDAREGHYPEDKVALLEQKVDLKLDVLATAIRTGRAAINANQPVGQGKATMDDIRGLLGELKARATDDANELITESTHAIDITRWTTTSLGIAAMLLVMAVFVLIDRQATLRLEMAELLASENERLEREVVRRTFELSTMAQYLSNVREAEKGRLARELHDELGAILTSAKMDTSWIARKIDATTMNTIRERFERVVAQLNNGIALKRRIIDNLRPPLLEELGLTASLQSMADELRAASGMEIVVDAPEEEPPLSGEKCLALFRIAQESITNVRKYAKATRVRISLACIDSRVRLEIADNGTGFDPQSVSSTHGIAGMRYRVQVFGGRFAVESSPGGGTTVRAEIALDAPKA